MTALVARLRRLDGDQVADILRRLSTLAAAAAAAVDTFRAEVATTPRRHAPDTPQRVTGTSTRRNERPNGRA